VHISAKTDYAMRAMLVLADASRDTWVKAESIAEQQHLLARIEAFETEHRPDLTQEGLCWAGDPRGCRTRA